MLPKYPMPTSSLVIAPRLRPLAERPKLLRRCALFATGRGSNEVAPTAGAKRFADLAIASANKPRSSAWSLPRGRYLHRPGRQRYEVAPFHCLVAGDLLRYPTTGITDCCARAASGHAAAPPSNVMNSRRLVCRERSIVRGDRC